MDRKQIVVMLSVILSFLCALAKFHLVLWIILMQQQRMLLLAENKTILDVNQATTRLRKLNNRNPRRKRSVVD